MFDKKSKEKHMLNTKMKQGSILINPPISNATPLVIPLPRIQFSHATFINNNINIINHPYISSSSSRFIHHKHKYKTTTTMVEQIVETNGSDFTVEHIVTSNGSNTTVERKPRILCLHGFRTSGKIFETQTKKWPETVLEKVEFIFPDAPFPCNGKSEVEGIFDPPYYEWFQFNKEFTDYENLDKCLEYIEELMIKHAPIDGLAGFSQGAILTAALPGLQAKGIALTKVPKIKCLIVVSGAKFKNETWAEKAYSSPIQCPSLHFLGDADFLKLFGTELLKSAEDAVVIRHPKGHTIPRLDEVGLETMLKFIDRIQKIVSKKDEEVDKVVTV